MHSHGHPELAKKLNDQIPKTVNEMFEREAAGRRGREDMKGAEAETLKEILAMDNVNFLSPSPMIRAPKKQSLNKFCDYHGDRCHNTNDCYHMRKQIEEAVALEKLANLVKDIQQGLSAPTRSRLRTSNMSLVGFLGEVYHPLEVIDLRVTMREPGMNKMMFMETAIVRCHSRYNVILGRTEMRSLRAVGSTVHSMIKFPTATRVATLTTSKEALKECKQLEDTQKS
uniref:Reverse transcriptase domain-containing protein n=1 Tax=Tanacetum cinerariifolium TaxID=118510 RepID=A0A6L2KY92_TANCI|nr:reverse transcriptase domain-containing protein [Tanacetum cinerariifolium]